MLRISRIDLEGLLREYVDELVVSHEIDKGNSKFFFNQLKEKADAILEMAYAIMPNDDPDRIRIALLHAVGTLSRHMEESAVETKKQLFIQLGLSESLQMQLDSAKAEIAVLELKLKPARKKKQ